MILAVRCVLLSCLLCLPIPAMAGMVFQVGFDNTFDIGAIDATPPYVGSGELSFDNNLADGSYLLTSLSNLSFSFTIGGETWTEADSVFFDPDTEIVIFNTGRRFYFNGVGNSTPEGGSFDVINSNSHILTFEPNDFAAPPFTLYVTPDYFGNFGSIPEPSTWVLAATGSLFGLLAAKRRHKKNAA